MLRSGQMDSDQAFTRAERLQAFSGLLASIWGGSPEAMQTCLRPGGLKAGALFVAMHYVSDPSSKVKTTCTVTPNPVWQTYELNTNQARTPNTLLWLLGVAVGPFTAEEHANEFLNAWSLSSRGPLNRYERAYSLHAEFVAAHPQYRGKLRIYTGTQPLEPIRRRRK